MENMENFVFDVGNVLLTFCPEPFLKSLYEEETAYRLDRAIFQSREWIMLDEGTVTQREASRSLCEREPDLAAEIVKIMDSWPEMLSPIQLTVELLYALKRGGYRLFYLSNMHARASRYILEKFDFFKVFEGGLFSSAERMIKPDERFYRLLFRKMDIEPQESTFIDDAARNVAAANALGMKGVLYVDGARLREDLSAAIRA